MNTEEREDTRIYKAVVNHEEQYSIWPADRANPPGWNDAGKKGTKAECLAYHKGSLDGHEAVEPAEKDGRGCDQICLPKLALPWTC